MEYEDRVRIATPEGVDVELTLAGIGSRFIAAIFDFMLQGSRAARRRLPARRDGGDACALASALFSIISS